jgi:hypothetical protein
VTEHASTDRRRYKPAPGFEVLREDEIDPEYGRRDRWMYTGVVNGRRRMHANIRSKAEANYCSWIAYDGAQAMAPTDYDANERTPPGLRNEYTVAFGSWAQMQARLLAAVVADAGSMRRAAKVLRVPRATLSAWVKDHKRYGRWPR